MSSFPPRIFLLSPARLDGKRAHLLFHPVTMFPVARALHSTAGAPIGEIFTFLSGLYFRGKLAYAEAFARPPRGLNSGVFVITPNGGLLAPSVRVTLDDLARLAKTDIDPSAKEFRKPLQKDAKALAQALGPRGEPILLGSIATRKYVDVLLAAFPQELLFPSEFVGRGDMSRGGLMLRSVDAHLELAYVPVLSCGAPGPRSCLLGRPDPEPALTRVRLQTIPQRPMEGAAPVWRFGRSVSGPRNPVSPMQIDSWTVSPDEGRVGRLQRCSSVTTLTSEKLPDEDNDDEKHDD